MPDVAGQMERIVALLIAHPFLFIGGLVAVLLVKGFQKDGLFSRIFGYLEAKANKEAALEERRIEIIRMMEDRSQRLLPGIGKEEQKWRP